MRAAESPAIVNSHTAEGIYQYTDNKLIHKYVYIYTYICTMYSIHLLSDYKSVIICMYVIRTHTHISPTLS